MTDTTHVCRYPEMRGKVALVTGGTSGIGLATAQGFAREGATVVVTSRNEARAQEALKTFAKDAAVSWIGGDTSDGKSVERLIGEIRKRHGRLDYAFNNGGAIGGAVREKISVRCHELPRRSDAAVALFEVGLVPVEDRRQRQPSR